MKTLFLSYWSFANQPFLIFKLGDRYYYIVARLVYLIDPGIAHLDIRLT